MVLLMAFDCRKARFTSSTLISNSSMFEIAINRRIVYLFAVGESAWGASVFSNPRMTSRALYLIPSSSCFSSVTQRHDKLQNLGSCFC